MTPSIAELVNELFRMHRRPDGQEYANAEVARALDNVISVSMISKLRRGEVPNPGRETLLALCRFFKVPPSYFFPELLEAAAATGPGQPEETTPADTLALALRSTGLSPAVRDKVADLIRALQGDEKRNS